MSIIIVLIFALNFAISWWNAKSAGLTWNQDKERGGWPRFMSWMAAVMSAVGFSWCYLVLLLLGWFHTEPSFIDVDSKWWLSESELDAGLSLGYLIIAPFALYSGLMIWFHSLLQARRQRDLPSIGVAGYNTYAQIHNMNGAMRYIPQAWDTVKSFFFSDSSRSKSRDKDSSTLLIMIVLFAIVGGVLTTLTLIKYYSDK